jgi:hypothetical protein
MSDPLTPFASYPSPSSPYTQGYKNLVAYYDNFANSSQGIQKVMGKMHRELEALQNKAAKHDSDSLRQMISMKSQELQSISEVVKDDRETYFSEGKMIGEKVNAYMTLFHA